MRNFIKVSILVLFVSFFVGFTGTARAYSPTLNVYSSGNSDVTMTISGGQPNAPVVITFTPSGTNLPTQINGTTDFSGNFTTVFSSGGMSISSQVYATVGGQQVSTSYNNNGYSGGCTYNCGSPNGLSLSQTSLSLNVGQSATVTATYPYYSYGGSASNIYISSNSNSSVASASASGSQIMVYGLIAGSTTISVCQSSSGSACASLYVTVGGGSNCGYYGCSVGGLTLSPTSLSLTVGQSASVTATSPIYGYSNSVYISSNSNSSVASASVSGNQVTVYGISSGSTSISICQSSGSSVCASLYVTVSGSNCYGGSTYNCGSAGNVWFSPTNPTMYVGQSLAVSINSSVTNNASGYYSSANAYYVSSNSNSSAVTASVVGTVLNLYAAQNGTSNIMVCNSGLNFCGTLYVTVSGGTNCGYYGCSGNLTLSQSSLSLTSGQSSTITVSPSNYSTGSYYISSNTNSSVASANISGSSVYVNGLNAGTTNISVCQSSTSQCATLYVTVSGGIGYNSGFSLSQTSVALNLGQAQSVAIYGNGNYYLSSNSNSSVVSAGISGGTLTLTGIVAGSSTLSICQTTPTYQCATLYVTVNGYNGGYGSGSGSLWFNPASVSLSVGQNSSVSINTNYGYATGYYISSNNNSYVASASISGSQLNVYGLTAGNSSVTVCQSNGGCGSLYVTVGGSSGYYGGGALSLSQTSLTLTVGQTQAVTVYGNGSYYISGNNNSSAATVSVSGNTLNVYGAGSGSTTAAVCQSSPQTCVNLYITVSGSYYSGGGTGLSYPGGSSGSGGVLGASSYPNGSLISEGPTVYIVYKNTKTPFASSFAFTGLGFSFNNVLAVGNSGLAGSGYIISTPYARHPWGSWVKSGSTVYFVDESGLIPIPDWNTFLNNGGQANLIVAANSYDFKLPILAPMTTGDSRLQ